jgi:hypothetical protein
MPCTFLLCTEAKHTFLAGCSNPACHDWQIMYVTGMLQAMKQQYL